MQFFTRIQRALHRPDPTVWKSRKESRQELARRNTQLGWKRAPRTEIDPNSAEAMKAARVLNKRNLIAVARQEQASDIPSLSQQRALREARDMSIIEGQDLPPYQPPGLKPQAKIAEMKTRPITE